MPPLAPPARAARLVERPPTRSERARLSTVIAATFLLRLASRISFTILGFYLGQRIASTAAIALVLEAFYLSELVVSLASGGLSDRFGRRFFLLLSPVMAGCAGVVFFTVAHLLPDSRQITHGGWAVLIVAVLMGRLLEGAASGANVPATLSYLTDVTAGSPRWRTRAVTAFQMATVAGLVVAIPLGGRISASLNAWGFSVVVLIYLIVLISLALGTRGMKAPVNARVRPLLASIFDSLGVLRHRQVATFLPAWLSINGVLGAWIVLGVLTLAHKHARELHPHQLMYGTFTRTGASLDVGVIALFFVFGMAGWIWLIGELRRTTVMLVGMVGLGIAMLALAILNGLADRPRDLSGGSEVMAVVLLAITLIGVLILSGFTPAALTQLSAAAEAVTGRSGAVMGLYSLALAIGQLAGSAIAGVFVDRFGFYGLVLFSAILGVLCVVSVLTVRRRGDDLIPATGPGVMPTSP
ncbi:MAG TPA: MFS transporter [Candidatus Dormibacteraeota bacterium]|nr:MFS transporter [Candidatus Dormibacteraeota bacterium]